MPSLRCRARAGSSRPRGSRGRSGGLGHDILVGGAGRVLLRDADRGDDKLHGGLAATVSKPVAALSAVRQGWDDALAGGPGHDLCDGGSGRATRTTGAVRLAPASPEYGRPLRICGTAPLSATVVTAGRRGRARRRVRGCCRASSPTRTWRRAQRRRRRLVDRSGPGGQPTRRSSARIPPGR
jgi:hypothetical protein